MLLFPDMDFVGHRQRSYTAQRLEVMRREKKNASKVKRVVWKHNTAPVDGKSSQNTRVLLSVYIALLLKHCIVSEF